MELDWEQVQKAHEAYKRLPGGARNDAGPMQYLIRTGPLTVNVLFSAVMILKKDINMSSQFTTPVVTEMQVIPVAGHDSMLMNLSGTRTVLYA